MLLRTYVVKFPYCEGNLLLIYFESLSHHRSFHTYMNGDETGSQNRFSKINISNKIIHYSPVVQDTTLGHVVSKTASQPKQSNIP